MVYVFSRFQAETLGYDVSGMELLRASTVRLQVLAPIAFYGKGAGRPEDVPVHIQWLRRLEHCLNIGLSQFAQKVLRITMGFDFSVFPNDFEWNVADREGPEVPEKLLRALHNRKNL